MACLAALASSAPARARASSGDETSQAAGPLRCDGMSAREPPGPLSVRLRVVNQAPADDDILAVAQAEARSIWADAGLLLVWLDRGSAASIADGPIVTIIVRGVLRPRSTRSSAPRARYGEPLGWTLFAGGVRTDVIEVSLSATDAVVMDALIADRPVVDLPAQMRQPFVGRALGRVIAHEIGHWIGGRTHAPGGLMRKVLTSDVLIAHRSPAPPRDWISRGTPTNPAGPPGCG
jgi:hypothetical protein